jgi:exodeoxyribonuclease VII small subunit
MSDKISFEDKMQILEDIAQKMENGDISLEESVKSYEKGIELINECEEYIQTAKLKIQKISDGKIVEVN